MIETNRRARIVKPGAAVFARGLSLGSNGSSNHRLEDARLMTPTGPSLGEPDPARLSRLDADGNHFAGDTPTREAFLHRSGYRSRGDAVSAVEVLEETARLFLPLQRAKVVALNPEQLQALGTGVNRTIDQDLSCMSLS